MTADLQKGSWHFECDSCDAVIDGESSDFATAWAKAKREGWKCKKIADEWVRGCPRCGV